MSRKRRQRAATVSGTPFPVSLASAASSASSEQLPNGTTRSRTKCRENGDGCCVSARHSPHPEPPSLSRSEAVRAAHSRVSSSGSGAIHREEPSVVGMEDFPSPVPYLRRVASSDGYLNGSRHGKSFAVSERPPNGSARVGITAMQNATYCGNWSQVVLGATSAIMFLLVLCVSYALYILVTPYGQSIMNGVLLSIVMHPQSRLRSSLYMGTAVDRMTRMQQRWVVRGRLMGLVGSWLSLCHFASFVVMQGTFFLGLNKIHVHAHSALLEEASAAGRGAGVGVKGASTRTMPRCPYASHGATNPATQSAASTTRQGGAGGVSRPAGTSTSSTAASRAPPSTGVPPAQLHRRLVSTPRGRRALRWLTISIIVIVAHLLVGVTYFALLHAALGVVFAVTVPFLPADTFVSSMGRLWRAAVLLFFVVGLTLNLTADVLSISEAVRRTTSAVVGSGGGGGDDAAMVAPSTSNVRDGVVAVLGVENCTPTAPFAKVAVTGDSLASGEDATSEAAAAATSRADVDALSVLGEYRSRIEAFLIGKIQDLVVQELADMFSDGNVSKMVETLMEVLPPQLRAVVTRDDTVLAALEKSTSEGGTSSLSGGEDGTHEKAAAQPLSWRAVLANARGLRPASAIKSLVYDSLSGTSARTLNSASDTSVRGAAAAVHKVEINWLTVSRLMASRLLPYVEHALRLFFRVGSNLLGLFDSIYAVILFVFCYRYLTQLEHTVLYYGVAKLLRVMQPELGDHHARNIEQDITVSFITLLQSFWHLTWFHFCITFCAFKLWGFPTPFLLGLVSVVLALFPLVPKWLSPCSIALVYMLVQLGSLVTSEGTSCSGSRGPGEAHAAASTVIPLLSFPPGRSWIEVLVWGKPYVLHYTRALSFGLAVLLECGDEWLLCVSRGLRGGFFTEADGKGREQLQPFVIGTALVLGFVAYGTRGIVFGPLTVIVARVLFDNWDIVLANREPGRLTLPPSSFVGVEGNDDEETSMVESP
ncbi:hypothetical protein conserved [Leishmania donovani]|uniref:Hypothetical_protein_conserved n=1 Tax=Leishmania donovani TaxID=5661 RepID=A0A3S5H7C9_LEIDO|nr:hypothetical protein LdCL_240012100 [Leishmania donovani]CAJ1989145.1 hypothetical protein conserved [Leishmania donovani]VDZ45017.1 hypothetical_protein_conserved [Leishmania donovani]